MFGQPRRRIVARRGRYHVRLPAEERALMRGLLGDLRAELDCRRLACFAWQRAGQRDAALRAGHAGLDVARAMDGQTRASSTFEYLAKDLLALTASAAPLDAQEQLERELAALGSLAAGGYSSGRIQGSMMTPPSSSGP